MHKTMARCISWTMPKTLNFVFVLAALFTCMEAMTFEGTNSSYAEFPPWNVCSNASISFDFKTTQEDGLLMYVDDRGRYDFIKIMQTSGSVLLKFNMVDDSQSSIEIRGGDDINDGEWHTVEVIRNRSEMTLKVDGVPHSEVVIGSDYYFGESGIGYPVYFGGIPFSRGLQTLTLASSKFETRFDGEIRNVLYGNCTCATIRPPMVIGDGVSQYPRESCAVHDPCGDGCVCKSTDNLDPSCDCSEVHCKRGRPDAYFIDFNHMTGNRISHETLVIITIGQVESTTGRVGQGIHLEDGIGYINIGSHRDSCLGNLDLCSNGILLSAWIKPGTLREDTQFFSSGVNGARIYYEGGRLKFAADTSSWTWETSTTDIHPDEWQFMEFTWHLDKGSAIFINNQKVSNASRSKVRTNFETGAGYDMTYIGRGKGSTANRHYANMTIDEFEFWQADRDYLVSQEYILRGKPGYFYFNMDAVSDNRLVNMYDNMGQVVGGCDSVEGVLNNALQMNGMGQFIDLGEHYDVCLGNLDLCKHGITGSMWMLFYKYENNQFYYSNGDGCSISHHNGNIFVKMQKPGLVWEVVIPDLSQHEWHFMEYTWHPLKGLRVYIDNELKDAAKTPFRTIQSPHLEGSKVYVGRANLIDAGKDIAGYANFSIDEVEIWYADRDYLLAFNYIQRGDIDRVLIPLEEQRDDRVLHPDLNIHLHNGCGLRHALVGNGASLDGRNQYLTLGDQSRTCMGNLDKCAHGLTMSWFMNPRNFVQNGYLISGGPYQVYYDDGRVHFKYSTSTKTWEASTDQIRQNQWQKVDVSWDEERGLSVYIDNRRVAQTRNYVEHEPLVIREHTVYIGRPNPYIQGQHTNLMIDELDYWYANRDFLWSNGILKENVSHLFIDMDHINGNLLVHPDRRIYVRNNGITVDGVFDNAVYLNGNRQYIDAGRNIAVCRGSLQKCPRGYLTRFVIYPSQLSNNTWFISGVSLDVYYQNGRLHAIFRTPHHQWEVSTDRININDWNLIDLSWHSTDGAKIFINGEEADHQMFGSRYDGDYNLQWNLFIGRPNLQNITGVRYPVAKFDDFRQYEARWEYLMYKGLLDRYLSERSLDAPIITTLSMPLLIDPSSDPGIYDPCTQTSALGPEEQKNMQLDGESYIKYDLRRFKSFYFNSDEEQLSIQFKTTYTHGFLWSSGNSGRHTQVFIRSGMLYIAVKAELITVEYNIDSPDGRELNDNEWHSITISRSDRRMTVSLDGNSVLYEMPYDMTMVNPSTEIHIGGSENVRALTDSRVLFNFNGDLAGLKYQADRIPCILKWIDIFLRDPDYVEEGGDVIIIDPEEALKAISFTRKGSYLRFPSWYSRSSGGHIELYLKTNESNTMIAYHRADANGYFAIEMADGIPHTIIVNDQGYDRFQFGQTSTRVDDGKGHHIKVEVLNNTFFLTLDHRTTVHKYHKNLEMELGPQFLLGAIDNQGRLPWHMGTGVNDFLGCVWGLKINNTAINLHKALQRQPMHGLQRGCVALKRATNITTDSNATHRLPTDPAHPVKFCDTNNSYLGFNVLETYSNLEISLFINTEQPEGLLMFNGDSSRNYIGLFLHHGWVFFTVNDGNEETTLVARSQPLHDNNWHKIDLQQKGTTYDVTVDGLATSTDLQRTSDGISFTGYLFIGGVPLPVKGSLPEGFTATSLTGCVGTILVNGHLLHPFRDAPVKNGVLSGCIDTCITIDRGGIPPERGRPADVTDNAVGAGDDTDSVVGDGGRDATISDMYTTSVPKSVEDMPDATGSDVEIIISGSVLSILLVAVVVVASVLIYKYKSYAAQAIKEEVFPYKLSESHRYLLHSVSKRLTMEQKTDTTVKKIGRNVLLLFNLCTEGNSSNNIHLASDNYLLVGPIGSYNNNVKTQEQLYQCKIQIWDLATDEATKILMWSTGPSKAKLEMSGKKCIILSQTDKEGNGRVFDMSDLLKPLREWKSRKRAGLEDYISFLSFSNDDEHLIAGFQNSCDHRAYYYVFDLNQIPNQAPQLRVKDAHIETTVVFHKVVTGTRQGDLCIWSMGTDNESTFEAHDGAVTALALSKDGNQLVSASDDKTVKVWRMESAEPQIVWTVHFKEAIRTVIISTDNDSFACGYPEELGTVHLLQPSKHTQIATYKRCMDMPSAQRANDPPQCRPGCIPRLVWEREDQRGDKSGQSCGFSMENRCSSILTSGLSAARSTCTGCFPFQKCNTNLTKSQSDTVQAVSNRLRKKERTETTALNPTESGLLVRNIDGHDLWLTGYDTLQVGYPNKPFQAGCTQSRYKYTLQIWDISKDQDNLNLMWSTEHSTASIKITDRIFLVLAQEWNNEDSFDMSDLLKPLLEMQKEGKAGDEDPISYLSFSNDGQYVVAGFQNSFNEDAHYFVFNRKRDRNQIPQEVSLNAIVEASEVVLNNYVITGKRDGEFCMWNMETGEQRDWPESGQRHKARITALASSNDEEYLVSASVDKKVKVWDLETEELIYTLAERCCSDEVIKIRIVMVTEDNELLVTGSHDRTIHVWRLADGHHIAAFPNGVDIPSVGQDTDCCPWTQLSVPCLKQQTDYESDELSYNNETTQFINSDTPRPSTDQQTTDAERDESVQIKFGPIKPLLFHMDDGNEWSSEFEFSCQETILEGQTATLTEIDPHYIEFTVLLQQRKIRVVDSTTNQPLMTLSNVHPRINITMSDNVCLLLSPPDEIGNERSLDMSDLLGPLLDLKNKGDAGISDHIRRLSFSNDNQYVLAGFQNSLNHNAYYFIFDLTLSLSVKPRCKMLNALVDVAKVIGDHEVITGKRDGELCIWSMNREHKHLPERVQLLNAHDGCVTALALSTDGKLLVSGSDDGAVKVWDAETLRLKYRLTGHRDVVWCASIAEDNAFIVTGSRDGTVCMWYPTNASPIAGFDCGMDITSVRIAKDKETIFAVGDCDKACKLVNLQIVRKPVKPVNPDQGPSYTLPTDQINFNSVLLC